MSLLVGGSFSVAEVSYTDLEEEHGRIQEEGESKLKEEDEDSEDDTPVYSLVTGELHQVRRFGHREEKKGIEGTTQDALVVRNKEEGLVKRQGLESVAGKSRRNLLSPVSH